VAHTTLSVLHSSEFPQNFSTIIDRKIQPLFDLVEKVMANTQSASVKKAVCRG